MGLIKRIQGPLVYLDTNIFVYLFEGFDPYISLIVPLIEKIEKGEIHSFTSELTLAEALVKPLRDQNEAWQKVYQYGIQTSPTLTVAPITRDILIQAAVIRARNNLKLPDSIHMATAQLSSCKTFLTNDKHIKSIDDINVIYLDASF